MSQTNRSKEEEDISQSFEKLNLNTIKISRKFVGSYCWKEEKKIYIPGFPAKLKKFYEKVPIGMLQDEKMEEKEIHPNELMHEVYFEPVQELLQVQSKKDYDLKKYDIITDKNNLRKIDATIRDDQHNYLNFTILLRKFGDLLVVKREEPHESSGSKVGILFEEFLTEPNDFFSCHIVVDTELTTEKTVHRLLIRGETDCCFPYVKTPSVEDYELSKTTPSGLEVYKIKEDSYKLNLEDLGEVKMSGQLKDNQLFQSWIIGISSIVHVTNPKYRKTTKVIESTEYRERFAKAVEVLLSYRNEMKENKTYSLERKNGGRLQFEQSDDERKWTAEL